MRLSRDIKIGIGWTICTIGGLSLFYLSKTSIEKKRYENMKIRQRMKAANEGEYESPKRYKSSTI